MHKRYSVAEARQNLAAILHELEAQPVIELTRRGAPVAVLLSMDAYHRLRGETPSFWEAYIAFRATLDPATLADEANAFQGVRDRSAGREVSL
jgi:prevent-host-death family protein